MNIAEKISLITKTYSIDSIGQRVETQSTKDVFAMIEFVSQSEFYQAGQSGLKPDFKMTVRLMEYGGEESLKYKNVEYSIYRTYRRTDGRIELYVVKKVGDS